MGHFSWHVREKTTSDPIEGCVFSAFSFSSLCCPPSLSGLPEENLILGGDTAAINFADIVRAPDAIIGVQRPVAGILGATKSVMLESLRLGPAGPKQFWPWTIGPQKIGPRGRNRPACLVCLPTWDLPSTYLLGPAITAV